MISLSQPKEPVSKLLPAAEGGLLEGLNDTSEDDAGDRPV